MSKHIAPEVLKELWNRVEAQFAHPINLFVDAGIRPLRGEKKKDAERKVWLEVAQNAFLAGVQVGYDMGHEVFSPASAAEEAAPSTTEQE